MSEAPQNDAVAEEDRARADSYALVSRLFYVPLEQELLHRLGASAQASPEAGYFEADTAEAKPADYPAALLALQHACVGADAETIRQEYDALFVGAGRALVTPYTSGYAVPHAPDRHVVALREKLAAWGLARREAVFEVEDHVAAVCDVMRWLIEHDRPLDMQRGFFDEFVYIGVGAFCDAIRTSEISSFYRVAAAFTRALLELDKAAFELHAAE